MKEDVIEQVTIILDAFLVLRGHIPHYDLTKITDAYENH